MGKSHKKTGKSLSLPVVLWLALAPLSAQAALPVDSMAGPGGDLGKPGVPVQLSAAELGYDRKNALVVARGHVEVVQGDSIVLADRITYNQNTNEVHATGNVSLRQPNGDVLFAENVRLKDNLEAGVIQNFRARLADNSLFAAREARKLNPQVTELDYAVYSPCKVCDNKDPLWQLKAKKVTIDENEQQVTYNEASLEFWGVPVAWTPYFSHATPDADSKSGLLTPELKASSELGTTVKLPTFIAIAPNADATITPFLTTQEAPVLLGEYRHLFENGSLQLRGSGTVPEQRDSLGNRVDGREFRGHLDGFANFRLNDEWHWGAQLRRTTDDTYMRRYDISNDDMLTSTLFVEGIEGRQWASLQALAFQRLTNDLTNTPSPYVVPLGDFWWQGDPGWSGSRLEMAANTMVLLREGEQESRRLTLRGAWSLPVITAGGQIVEAETSLRGDAYSVQDVPLISGGLHSGEEGRLIPELALRWRYPLINHLAPGKSLLIEPIAGFALSPNGQNDEAIPNEDSMAPEFSDSNLFSDNRYPGYDYVETGPRLQYGMRGQWQFDPLRRLNFLLGQNYQLNDENAFPYTRDPQAHASDYVGRLALDWENWLDLAYRFRFDQEDFALRRNEINTDFSFDPVGLHFDYLNLSDDPYLDNRQEVVANGSLRLTDDWTLVAGGRRDLDDKEMIYANTGLRYQDECFTLFANFARSFIQDRDVEPGTSFLVQVQMKNLE